MAVSCNPLLGGGLPAPPGTCCERGDVKGLGVAHGVDEAAAFVKTEGDGTGESGLPGWVLPKLRTQGVEDDDGLAVPGHAHELDGVGRKVSVEEAPMRAAPKRCFAPCHLGRFGPPEGRFAWRVSDAAEGRGRDHHPWCRRLRWGPSEHPVGDDTAACAGEGCESDGCEDLVGVSPSHR